MKNTQTGFEIAVIGMAGRFPGAKNIAEFWNNLKNGVESITFLSDNELDRCGVDLELRRDPHFVKARGGVLENKDAFDASFFGYSPLEAEVMDPQIRILHECAWEALENAGCNPEMYKGLIGIYCGASANIGWLAKSILSGKSEEIGPFEASQLMDKDFISTRLAYKFNLKGPAVFVQTACSTSLAAIHMACRALLMSECDMALAGGVLVISSERNGYLYQEGMIHSPDGHCRAFDAKAKGTVSGEGAGIVVLKRLKHAAADRDNIYAIIKGSALNNDGQRKVGYTAPGIDGQTRVIKAALKAAQVDPESISYIEAHGTGTVLGDPIEIEALKRAFNSHKTGFCAIGSVKTNIGHLDAAAGVAGFIKTVLALMNRQIPPSLHFQSPNPKIDFKNSPFYVNNQLKEWLNNEYPLRAGVSSFGIGGTNAHVILEEAPAIERSPDSRKWQMILLSARTETALNTMTGNLAGYFKQHPDLNPADAAYTLQVGRKRFPYREIIVGTDLDDITNGLTSQDPAKCHTHFSHEENPPVVFMFPGQGSQYVNMGLELYRAEPVFQMEMDRCFEILGTLGKPGIKEILYPPDLSSPASSTPGQVDQTGITQPLIFVFEYSLAKLLLKWGMTPYAMMGHSIGEYVAACLAGVISLEDALKLVTLRGDLMQKLPGGSMLSVDLPEAELIPLLEMETNVSLAAVNSSSHCVISGTHEAIETVAQKLAAKGHRCRKLHTSHAFHSHMMDPILDEFEKHVKQVCLNKPSLPYLSNVTGNWITAAEAVEPAYWAKHIRAAVHFEKGLQVLLKEEKAIFLEVGPGNVLSTFVRSHRDKREQFILNLIGHPLEKIPADYYLLTKIAQLWMYGVPMDWEGFYAGEKRSRVPLPAYPFEIERVCYSSEFKLDKFTLNDLNKKTAPGKQKNITDWFYIPTWKRSILSEMPPPTPPTGSDSKPPHVLLFADNLGWGNLLSAELTQKGWEVTIVRGGTGYSKQNDYEFIINPGDRHHYTTLFDDLTATGKRPGLIVHLWALTGNNDENEIASELQSEEVRNFQDLGFYSQLYIGAEIKRRISNTETRIIVISDHIHPVTGAEILCPAKATLLGPVRVIPQEYPLIKYKCIDIVVPGSDFLKERLRQQLSMEITCMHDNPGEIIAYRNGRRWLQTYEPVKLNEKNQHNTRLRERGVYVITGGLGHIGLILSEYLARKVQARLILIGRSIFPPRHEWEHWLAGENKPVSTREKILKIKEIERLGGEVSIYSADVSDLEQMQKLFAGVQEKNGTINGVIHAAGQLTGKSRQCPFEDITKIEGEEQFKSKVYGLINLEKILREKNEKSVKKLDFCMLTSSLAGVLGGLGFAAYAAAGSFMDAFAHHQLKKSSFPWLSIDWDGWETGENTPISKDGPILPHEGVQAFQRVLDWNEESQVIV
ncbi:MAG: type I polyketide synthase, partial [Acidobacteria bacterium]|nr:type I polyketide synthase [Acidobacteriota bacterium]